ncbi:MAG: hypothetical protein OEY79_00935 [Anaplasmataceae bacterium]|nr:hypothetical protein [Candidatus Heimdallarchaeota archaeon]MDH5796093.1 hypothetical protein [Anaplasmataceae bacterium]
MRKLKPLFNVISNINYDLYSTLNSRLITIINHWKLIVNDELLFLNSIPIGLKKQGDLMDLHVNVKNSFLLLKMKYIEKNTLQNIAIIFGFLLVDRLILKIA